MASLEKKVQSVRATINSISPETVATLNELLLPKEPPKPTIQATKNVTKSRANKQSNPGKTENKRPVINTLPRQKEHDGRLTAKQRSILATEVINATLKTLSEAIKASASCHDLRYFSNESTKASKRNCSRKSNSVPSSPRLPKSSDNTANSPRISIRGSRSSNASCSSNSAYRPTVECARISFACLRILQASNTGDVNLPPLHLESGMSVLIGKLLSLGIHDLATREIRILKRRLVFTETGKSETLENTLAELLDFGKANYTGARLGLVITTQLQILRLITYSKKPRLAESALSLLRSNHLSSPTRLLLAAAKSTKDPKQVEKFVRQIQNLSEILLTLCPSISVSDDALAAEPRLSVSSRVAILLQSLALYCRSLWWDLAGHKGDVVSDILEPFLRCITAFYRRSKSPPSDSYSAAVEAFEGVEKIMENCSTTLEASQSVMAGIYNILACLAKNDQHIDAAIKWTNKVYQIVKASKASETKVYSVEARLVSLRLQSKIREPKVEEQLLMLLDILQRPFKGEASEVEELLIDVSQARRVALSIFCQHRVPSSPCATLNDGLLEMCKSLVFLYPRLSLRYLGISPDPNSDSKEKVRYEHRRQFISQLSINAIDSVLFLVKTLLGEGVSTWEFLDSRLQDCVSLLDRINLGLEENSKLDSQTVAAPSYAVRISNLYYSLFLNMQRNPESPKDVRLIRALWRSIACVRGRSTHEKKAALFTTKLERLAEICKDTGRYDELLKTLCILRDEMIADGVLSVVLRQVASKSLKTAWSSTRETEILGRTVHAILKVQFKHSKSVGQISLLEKSWSAEERAIVLEHELELLCKQPIGNQKIINEIQTIVVRELLRLYHQSKYPIRRTRILLKLLSINGAELTKDFDEVQQELERNFVEKRLVKGTEDEGLCNYLTHYKTVYILSRELDKTQPCLKKIEEGLATWSSLVDKSQSLAELHSHIDDVIELLSFLQPITDWLQVRGLDRTRLAALQLIADLNIKCDDITNSDEFILSFIALGVQWLRLGYSNKAYLALDRARTKLQRNGVSPYAKIQFYLSLCEYSLATGNSNEGECNLASAQALYIEAKGNLFTSKSETSLEQKIKIKLLISNVYDLHSKLAIERGLAPSALGSAKQSVRLLRRAWSNIEDYVNWKKNDLDGVSQSEKKDLTKSLQDVNLASSCRPSPAPLGDLLDQTSFWIVIAPLFRSLNHLSTLFAHHGVFQETVYYAEQSYKLAKQIDSNIHVAMSGTILGSIWLKGGNLKKGSELLSEAKSLLPKSPRSLNAALLAFNFGRMHGLLADYESEISSYDEAAIILGSLISENFVKSIEKNTDPVDDLEKQMSQVNLSRKKAPEPRRATTRAVTKGKVATRVKIPVDNNTSFAKGCPSILAFRSLVLREKARAQILQKRCVDTSTFIQEAEPTISSADMVNYNLTLATCLLLQSLEQINSDPVYSILQDSTISYPAILGTPKLDKNADKILSPSRRAIATRSCGEYTISRSSSAEAFFDNLRRAQDYLKDSLSVAHAVSPTTVFYKITHLLNSIAILLSTASRIKGKSIVNPGLSSLVVETARCLVLRREREIIPTDTQITLSTDESSWPQLNISESKKPSLGFNDENLNRFSREYIDIIPKQWTVISISLSESQHELSLTRLEPGHSPFILRLPLGRNNSIDADEEVLGYEQGRAELLEIIRLANESAHDSRNRLGREARLSWWKEREALDARMKTLLENIEKVWLGGFTGIFSQHVRRPDLISRFQKSFQNILDKYLPSRQKKKIRNSAPRITLDSRILDLFIGLGNVSKEHDLSEPLTDLFYFVVDILQFHGELNAYAEIDFDMIVVEITDALRCYHDAVCASGPTDEGRQTILVLDKVLHSFPWESLPCFDGIAVSRIPSLGCLRERIIHQQGNLRDENPDGHYINRSRGSYILNPDGDLKNTLATFQKPLQGLDGWNGILNRGPSEEEFRKSLQESDIFLYFGHGSGSQYIRAREIKRLPRCAVSMLMGCSSGALVETGEFEPYGPAINYMHAGCHALVATLWDVTDRDIDRFAKSTLEHWGLFPSKPEPASNERGQKSPELYRDGMRTLSLVEAVAEGRKACKLRYLNAAAVCVYGVPVYLKD